MSEASTASTNLAPFQSASALRDAHTRLLQQQREDEKSSDFLTAVADFVRRGQATGALLDADDERHASQSLLDYWSTVLYRADQESLDPTLDEFDPTLAPTLPDEPSPYLGLDTFREPTHDWFFGRERSVRDLIARLRQDRLLVVIGPSGSGKSSLVRAGLLPALRNGALPGSREWRFLTPIVPGTDPLAGLARLLRSDQLAEHDNGATAAVPPVAALETNEFRSDAQCLTRLIEQGGASPAVLVVDQFEEVFTLCEDRATRQAFVANLLALADAPAARHIVVLTMRSDFEPNVAGLVELQQRFEQASFRVTPLLPPELREAIERPAEQVGLKFESGVVDALLQDILGEPAALPLLQFSLLKLWEQRDHNRVTWDQYRHLGGGRLALARSADEFYNGLIPEEQVTARRILLRMVRPGEGLEVTSNRVRREALYQGGEDPGRVNRVIEKLVAARLVRLSEGDTPTDTQIEVAHEALVRNWPLLVDWLEDERAALNVRRRLEAKADEWVRLGRGASGLLDEVQLQEIERWLASREAADLGYSQALPDLAGASRAALDVRIARQRRLQRLRIGAITIAVISIIVALSVGLYSASQLATRSLEAASRESALRSQAEEARKRADQEKIAAESAQAAAVAAKNAAQQASDLALQESKKARDQARIAMARQLAGQAARMQDNQQADLAMLLSIESLRQSRTVEGQSSLLSGLVSDPIVTYLRGHSDAVRSIAYSPDGATLASGSYDGTVILWDIATSKPRGKPLTGHNGEVRTVAFSPDGATLASGGIDKTVILWDVASGRPRRTPLTGHTDTVRSVAFSPDGTTLASGGDDKTVILWDVATGRQRPSLPTNHTLAVRSVAFSPDGTTLATGSDDQTIMLWNLATGKLITKPLAANKNGVATIAFSADGRTLASGGEDSTIKLWDVPAVSAGTALTPTLSLRGHTQLVYSVAFNHDMTTLASASVDGTVMLWNVATGEAFPKPLITRKGIVYTVAFSPDDRRLASGGSDGTIILRDMATVRSLPKSRLGRQLGQAIDEDSETSTPNDFPFRPIALSPNDRMLAIASADNNIHLLDVGTHRTIGAPLVGHTGQLRTLAFSPDGKSLASAGEDQNIILWDIATHKPLGPALQRHQTFIWSIAFSPDGKLLASSDGAGNIFLWDVPARQWIGSFDGHTEWVNRVLFSKDGAMLISASDDNTIRRWSVATMKPIGEPLDLGYSVHDIALSPDGKQLVAGYANGQSALWDIEKPRVTAELSTTTDLGAVISTAFNSDGKTMAIGYAEGQILFWDVATKRPLNAPLAAHKGFVMRILYTSNGTTIVSSGTDQIVRQWQIATLQPIGAPFAPPTQNVDKNIALNGVAISPNGKLLAAAGDNGKIVLRDLPEGKLIAILQPDNLELSIISSVSFSPDGRTLVALSCLLDKGTCRSAAFLWDTVAHTLIAPPLPIPLDRTEGVAFSPSGDKLAFGGCAALDIIISKDQPDREVCSQGAVLISDLTMSQPSVVFLPFPNSSVLRVAFTADGRTLAVGGKDGTIRLWDVATHKPIGDSLKGHQDSIRSLAFGPGGKLLASGSDDNTVRLWDVATGQPAGLPLIGHQGAVAGVAFSPDGSRLATGGSDRNVILWDVATGQQIGPALAGHQGRVTGLAFTPDGATLASVSRDRTTILWDTSLESWRQRGCAIAARNLRWEEWKQYLAGLSTNYQATCPNSFFLSEVLEQANTDAQAGNRAQAEPTFQQIARLATTDNLAVLSADACRLGALDGFAATVMQACDRAVDLAPDNYRRLLSHDRRGIARALVGDAAGAIKDFTAYIDLASQNGIVSEQSVELRKTWVDKLQPGGNPFDTNVLDLLRREQN